MIYMIYSFGEDFNKNIFVFQKKELNLNIFLNKSKVQHGSFSAQIMENIFNCLTSELICLNDYYDSFYKLDYATFKEFLIKKYFVPKEFLESYKNILKEIPEMKIYHKKQFSYGNYVIEDFIFSESMLTKISNLLMSIVYEN